MGNCPGGEVARELIAYMRLRALCRSDETQRAKRTDRDGSTVGGGILGTPLGRLHGGNRRLSVGRGSPWRINLMR